MCCVRTSPNGAPRFPAREDDDADEAAFSGSFGRNDGCRSGRAGFVWPIRGATASARRVRSAKRACDAPGRLRLAWPERVYPALGRLLACLAASQAGFVRPSRRASALRHRKLTRFANPPLHPSRQHRTRGLPPCDTTARAAHSDQARQPERSRRHPKERLREARSARGARVRHRSPPRQCGSRARSAPCQHLPRRWRARGQQCRSPVPDQAMRSGSGRGGARCAPSAPCPRAFSGPGSRAR